MKIMKDMYTKIMVIVDKPILDNNMPDKVIEHAPPKPALVEQTTRQHEPF